ncbi:MAG: TetR/AcrR family transcriptional regulator [Bacteroidetes bacterium]|nr:TetR/AcrR family transcriptional regulator [Bacteroidota bacterium]
MQFQIKITPNDRLALRDPEDTPLGRNIVRQGLVLMHKLGYEHFTFKKLADEIHTTEASIYRYFENKHRLLLYILSFYWNFLEYLVVFYLQNLNDTEQKIQKVIELLVEELPEDLDNSGLDKKALYQIVIAESNKTYLTREVNQINQVQLFKPYKDLCGRIAELFIEYNPSYPYPRSLASTLMEMAHLQTYFMHHLPRLTDFHADQQVDNVKSFMQALVFSSLNSKSE